MFDRHCNFIIIENTEELIYAYYRLNTGYGSNARRGQINTSLNATREHLRFLCPQLVERYPKISKSILVEI
jgi:hypothetical protein